MFTTYARALCIALLTAVSVLQVQAAPSLSDPLPVGPQVTVGQLSNGLTYYIQKNNRPERRLELRLVVKAGSILEDEDQLGLAHFTEHMAFNGSTHFKKHELVSYLQSIGLKFGADLNAYTGFNETVYILPIPTDKPENIEKGFLVLEDWAHGVSFVDADIELERAIVLEELRLGKGAQDRMNKVVLPKIFSGSSYAKRLPIGTEDSLKGFQYDAIKRFYRDWYRPNLMAVVVVGDIEVAAARTLVESHFGKLKNPQNERPRTYPTIPARGDSEAVVVTDREATNNVMMIRYPVQAAPTVTTLGDYRQSMVEQLFGAMLGQRMQELTQKANPPFVGGGSSVSRLVPGYRSFQSGAMLGRQGVEPAADALVQENARARQFGFSEAELERSKKDTLRNVENAFAEREKTDSARYAAEYLRNFLESETIPGIENELAYTRALLPTIGLADVNAFARSVIPEKAAKLVIYTGTTKTDAPAPAEPQLLASVVAAEQKTVSANVEKALASSLLATLPTGGTVLAERQNAALGVTEWDLSNGVKVILKPTDFKNDEILLSATRFGGQSLFDQADMYNAGYASSIVSAMGLGGFTPTELQKMLAGKVASVNAGLGGLTENVSASSSPADLETMLQLLTLKFGNPRVDPALFQSYVSRAQDAARNATARPESVFSDALQTTLYGSHPRTWLTPRPAHFDQLSLERVRAIYQQRFASAKGMTFLLVGSFSTSVIKPLVARYLGSLPTSDISASYFDLGMRPVSGVVKKDVRAGSEPKSLVSINFAGAAAYSETEQMRVSALVEVLNIKIIDVLREKLTLIYGGGMRGGLGRDPYGNFMLGMSLPCAPENVDKVVAAAFGEIRKIQEAGPEASDLAKVKQNWLTKHRENLRENRYWMGKLQTAELYKTDPALLLDYEKQVSALTVDDIKGAAQRYLKSDNYVQVVLYPEK
ncbi:MAG TPA: insulinase family protein [Rhodoferax sp.]|jgi:zinc protease|nr:insulinase family protein [Rhodoferax sp.]HPW28248.1 insulinase family protein [Rhodoferax sp.]